MLPICAFGARARVRTNFSALLKCKTHAYGTAWPRGSYPFACLPSTLFERSRAKRNNDWRLRTIIGQRRPSNRRWNTHTSIVDHWPLRKSIQCTLRLSITHSSLKAEGSVDVLLYIYLYYMYTHFPFAFWSRGWRRLIHIYIYTIYNKFLIINVQHISHVNM